MLTASVSQVLAASAARTATATLYTHDGDDYAGVTVIIKSTASAATPSVVFTIEGYDEAAASWISLLASAAVTDGSTTALLQVSPAVGNVNNVSRGMRLPRKWRVVATHADADSITYSVGAWLEQGS